MAVVGQPKESGETSQEREDSKTVSELMRRLDEKSREADKLKKKAGKLEQEVGALTQMALDREKNSKDTAAQDDKEMELEALRAKADEFDRKGNLLDAFHLYRRIIRLNPEDIGALYRIATIYYSVGMGDKAAQALRFILELDPGQQKAVESLAELERGS
ncbi:MAG: hypothetical protein OEZ04_00360 [Nitrospinota bacterium]|nr:hypothetical protein [Nitrospinota bacterium]